MVGGTVFEVLCFWLGLFGFRDSRVHAAGFRVAVLRLIKTLHILPDT